MGECTHLEFQASGMHGYRDQMEFLPGVCHLLPLQTGSAQPLPGGLHAGGALSWGKMSPTCHEESKTQGDDVLGTRGTSFSS